jgi:acetylornithine deacetylase/succinyl-diaminopimelate desuccinylase-like protein
MTKLSENYEIASSRKSTRFAHDPTIYEHPVELLQNLIRFDTTNPPGNEAECIKYINTLLTDVGFETVVLFKDINRPNVIARLKGQGATAPILLHGHVDVVTTAYQKWTHPPFEAEIADGYIWGRGALDMKSGVAMMLAAFLRAKAEHLNPSGDIVLAIVSDEEAGGNYGAKFLVENHQGYFEGIRYAIGELGGFSLYSRKKNFYPIMVSEEQICQMKTIIRGFGGHGSIPMYGGSMAKVDRLLRQLDTKTLGLFNLLSEI